MVLNSVYYMLTANCPYSCYEKRRLFVDTLGGVG